MVTLVQLAAVSAILTGLLLLTSATECEVTEWNEWSKCIGTCLLSMRTRNRDVSKPPFPEIKDGKVAMDKCPPLYQVQQCVIPSCPSDPAQLPTFGFTDVTLSVKPIDSKVNAKNSSHNNQESKQVIPITPSVNITETAKVVVYSNSTDSNSTSSSLNTTSNFLEEGTNSSLLSLSHSSFPSHLQAQIDFEQADLTPPPALFPPTVAAVLTNPEENIQFPQPLNFPLFHQPPLPPAPPSPPQILPTGVEPPAANSAILPVPLLVPSQIEASLPVLNRPAQSPSSFAQPPSAPLLPRQNIEPAKPALLPTTFQLFAQPTLPEIQNSPIHRPIESLVPNSAQISSTILSTPPLQTSFPSLESISALPSALPLQDGLAVIAQSQTLPSKITQTQSSLSQPNENNKAQISIDTLPTSPPQLPQLTIIAPPQITDIPSQPAPIFLPPSQDSNSSIAIDTLPTSPPLLSQLVRFPQNPSIPEQQTLQILRASPESIPPVQIDQSHVATTSSDFILDFRNAILPRPGNFRLFAGLPPAPPKRPQSNFAHLTLDDDFHLPVPKLFPVSNNENIDGRPVQLQEKTQVQNIKPVISVVSNAVPLNEGEIINGEEGSGDYQDTIFAGTFAPFPLTQNLTTIISQNSSIKNDINASEVSDQKNSTSVNADEGKFFTSPHLVNETEDALRNQSSVSGPLNSTSSTRNEIANRSENSEEEKYIVTEKNLTTVNLDISSNSSSVEQVVSTNKNNSFTSQIPIVEDSINLEVLRSIDVANAKQKLILLSSTEKIDFFSESTAGSEFTIVAVTNDSKIVSDYSNGSSQVTTHLTTEVTSEITTNVKEVSNSPSPSITKQSSTHLSSASTITRNFSPVAFSVFGRAISSTRTNKITPTATPVPSVGSTVKSSSTPVQPIFRRNTTISELQLLTTASTNSVMFGNKPQEFPIENPNDKSQPVLQLGGLNIIQKNGEFIAVNGTQEISSESHNPCAAAYGNKRCCRAQFRTKCPDGKQSQMVMRWHRIAGQSECSAYNYGYCGLDLELQDQPIKFEQECYSICYSDLEKLRSPVFKELHFEEGFRINRRKGSDPQ